MLVELKEVTQCLRMQIISIQQTKMKVIQILGIYYIKWIMVLKIITILKIIDLQIITVIK